MANNTLDRYLEKQAELKSQIKANSLPPDMLVVYQELNYRIDVLESCKAFCNTAPTTTDERVMMYHYSLVYRAVSNLAAEHKIGPKTDEEGKNKREAAQKSLEDVILSGAKRFQSYKISSQDQYRKDVCAFVNSVLSVWIGYRNTYVNI